VAQRAYEVGGLVFGLRSNSKPFLRWADEVLGEFSVENDDEIDPYYSVLVGGAGGDGGVGKRFHILYREANSIVRSLDLGAVGRGLLLDVESLTFPKRDDSLYLDAPVISGHGANIVMPADFASFFNRGGKKLERAGVSMPLTWATALDVASGRAQPPRMTLPVPADALERLQAVASSTPNGSAAEPGEPVAVDAFCFLGFGVGATFGPVGASDAVYRLAKVTRNLKVLRRGALDALARMVEQVPCFELQSDVLDPLLATLVDVMQDVAGARTSS
jgi:hypothetical protein